MAARFWVGGTGTWDSTTTANWSATSGGASGASVPGAADDVTIDTASITVTTNYNVSVISVTINASAATLSLGGTLTCSGAITLTQGTFTTNNFNVTATSLSSDNTNTRTINLGSSTVTLSGSGSVVQFTTTTGMTFNAGTSTIVLSSATSPNLNVAATGLTFYDVSFTGANATQQQVSGANTFRNLTIAGRTSIGIKPFIVGSNQTISGTLTLSAGTNATMRTFVRSDTIGTTRTLTCAAFSGTDADFRDITIAGAAAPVSGTRLGDCKGNSGITFPAAKTAYRFGTATSYAGSNSWSLTPGGAGSNDNFPLAQDAVVFIVSPSVFPASGGTVTVDAAYNIGTIDMSARTSNTMTLATGAQTPAIYGNWINGTGTTLTGTGLTTFAGRGSQTITSAGKSFTQIFTINTPGGSVALQDALTGPASSSLTLTSGTFNLNSYNATVNAFSTNNSNIRTLAVGSGTLTLVASGVNVFNATTSTNLTVTGAGTISLTSASAKTFIGGGIQTYPTLSQGGTGTLTVSGSNKFAGLTNTAIGRIQFTGGATNEFTSFTINGVLGNLLQLGSSSTTQAILIKPTAWLMGANSTDGGNNTGLSFTAGGGIDYLSASYINGQVSTPSVTYAGNFFAFF